MAMSLTSCWIATEGLDGVEGAAEIVGLFAARVGLRHNGLSSALRTGLPALMRVLVNHRRKADAQGKRIVTIRQAINR